MTLRTPLFDAPLPLRCPASPFRARHGRGLLPREITNPCIAPTRLQRVRMCCADCPCVAAESPDVEQRRKADAGEQTIFPQQSESHAPTQLNGAAREDVAVDQARAAAGARTDSVASSRRHQLLSRCARRQVFGGGSEFRPTASIFGGGIVHSSCTPSRRDFREHSCQSLKRFS